MNSKATPSHLTETTDILLADVAIRIQLRPTHSNQDLKLIIRKPHHMALVFYILRFILIEDQRLVFL